MTITDTATKALSFQKITAARLTARLLTTAFDENIFEVKKIAAAVYVIRVWGKVRGPAKGWILDTIFA